MTKLEFLKPRSFGSRIADVFVFLKQNFKPFSKGLLTITLPVICVYAIVAFMFYSNYLSLFGMQNRGITPDYTSVMGVFWMLPMYLLVGITSLFIAVGTLSYVKFYNEDKEREITSSMLWLEIKRHFWRVLGANLLLGVTIVFAIFIVSLATGVLVGGTGVFGGISALFFVFFPLILALIWFSVRIIFSTIFIVIENKSIIQSFKDSYNFTKGIFWKTLGFIVVVTLLVNAVSQIFSLPGVMFMYADMFLGIGSFARSFGNVLIALGSSVGLILYCVVYIGYAIFYFSEKEQRYGIMANLEIDKIGSQED
jgi:hypothetical protein